MNSKMAMPMQHAEMGHVAPDGVVYHQRIDPTAEHEELRHMDEELVDPNEYVDEQEVCFYKSRSPPFP